MGEDYDRGGYRDDRYRSSRHDDRDAHRGDRDHRNDRDRYGGDRERGGGHRRSGGDDRRERDRYSRLRDYDDQPRHSPRYEDDRRRDFRGPREDDQGAVRSGRDDGGPPRGGGGGERRGRGKGKDGLGTPERRSPTPEGAVPLSQRKRKASGWDVHAPGYEQYSALQAKQTGMSFCFVLEGTAHILHRVI
ncbi:hypothetical protein K443DRAFT_128041 [Laccaria amethystina LaAM-08-1]|uniref:Uncharacterized protein n=1 Tax=Laccaria amethystina LaAM-08-1 TaxID=1095629 RepID=A0A0C9Y558_9AGAR|nr:hypothetical protein K443DRAFT_128041 [Laccaria amethystina LaAM-08-1]